MSSTVEILGSNVRFLGCTMCSLVGSFSVFIALMVAGVFVPVPRILGVTMTYSYNSITYIISRNIILAGNFTSCAMILGIFAALIPNKTIFYSFSGLLSLTMVLEVTFLYFSEYHPIENLRDELTVHMLSMMNEDVKLMERKGIDKIETLQEVNQQPLAKLQQQLACCGVESIRDWEVRVQDTFKQQPQNETIPISCCWHPHQKVKYFCTATEAYRDTCLSKAIFYLTRYFLRCLRILVTLFAMQALILLFYWTKVYHNIIIVPRK